MQRLRAVKDAQLSRQFEVAVERPSYAIAQEIEVGRQATRQQRGRCQQRQRTEISNEFLRVYMRSHSRFFVRKSRAVFEFAISIVLIKTTS